MSILSLMRNDEICDDSLDMIEGQLEQLRVSRVFVLKRLRHGLCILKHLA